MPVLKAKWSSKIGILLLFAWLSVLPSQAQNRASAPSKDKLRVLADSLAQALILVDGHIDLPYRLKVKNFRFTREYLSIPLESGQGEFDWVRAKEGGLNAPFMSIYIPAAEQDPKRGFGGKALADSLIDLVEGVVDLHPRHFAMASHPDSVRAQFARGLVSLPMGMENGAPLAYPEDVAHFAERGIRYITLTHSKDNHICDSSYDSTRTWNGLSPYGVLLLEELSRHGMMIDISHVSDSAFYQVLRYSPVPVIASHSSLRHYTPGFERNMSDEMLPALARNGGVIMINFGSSFLDGEVTRERKATAERWQQVLKTRGLDSDTPEGKAVLDSLAIHDPMAFADVQTVADHIERAVRLAGIDHVGLGSDYDGVGDSLPTGLKDVSDYPNLLYVLLQRGFSVEDLRKICGENLLRVWDSVEAYRQR